MRQEILSASGFLAVVVLMLFERDQEGGPLELITAWIDRRSEVLLERERGRNLRQVVDRLPAGYEIVEQRIGRLQTIRIVVAEPAQGGTP